MRRRTEYYDFHIPRVPTRLKNWRRCIGYGGVELLRGGSVDLVSYRLEAPVPAASGRRIAFVSDLHYKGTPAQRDVVTQLREYLLEFKPELLLLGGDVCSDAGTLKLFPEVLKPLSDAVPQALAVPGNWERGKSWISADRWRDLFRSGGFDVGFNEFRTLDVFQIFCSEDPSFGNPVLPGEWTRGKLRILLTHRPDTVIALDEPWRSEAHLALCGHTHGGQLRLPFIGSIFAASVYGCRLDYGCFRHRFRDTVMIVSSGAGQGSFPWRINCRREMVLIDFL